jgi:cytoskeletal protein CcmA (bactofilin family)
VSRSAATQPRESAPHQPVARELPPPAPKKLPPLTVIAQGTAVDGRVRVEGDLRVDGRVEGPLLAAGASCEVSPGGSVAVETARAASLVVHGTLHAGEVVARRVLVTAAGALHARVVAAEGVEVEAGGTLAATLEIGAGD